MVIDSQSFFLRDWNIQNTTGEIDLPAFWEGVRVILNFQVREEQHGTHSNSLYTQGEKDPARAQSVLIFRRARKSIVLEAR